MMNKVNQNGMTRDVSNTDTVMMFEVVGQMNHHRDDFYEETSTTMQLPTSQYFSCSNAYAP